MSRAGIKVAIVQLDCKISRESANMKRAERYIRKAAAEGARLVCLPESFLTSGNLLEVADVAVTIPGDCTDRLTALARDFKLYIVAGLLEKAQGVFHSTSLLIDPNGDIAGIYRRTHCFEMERRYITPGQQYPVFDTEIGRIGLLQGYDVNFPESCRELYRKQVDIIACSALIPERFAYVTRQILLSRVIESQCYLIFASGVGANIYAGFRYMGHSQVLADPLFLEEELFDFEDGDEALVSMAMDEGYELVEINVDRLRKYRESHSLSGDLVPHTYWQEIPLVATLNREVG